MGKRLTDVKVLGIKDCKQCSRSFMAIESRCSEHCVPTCCRAALCSDAGARARPRSPIPGKICRVCHRNSSRIPWEAFAECDSNCQRIYFGTSRSDPSRSEVARKYSCEGVWGPRPELHRPAGKPRVHIDYCSLRCYYHSSLGHDARKREGIRRRNRRYWSKRGSKSAFITERNRTRARGTEDKTANTREGRDVIRRAAERSKRVAEVEAYRAQLTERFIANQTRRQGLPFLSP